MEGLLRNLMKAVNTVEFSDDVKEENIIRRWVLHDRLIQYKTLKDSSGVMNNFAKNKIMRQERRYLDKGNRGDYIIDYNKNNQYPRREYKNRDELLYDEVLQRAEEDKMVSKLKDQSKKNMKEESKDKIKPKFNQEKQQLKEKELKVIETVEEEIIQPQDIQNWDIV